MLGEYCSEALLQHAAPPASTTAQGPARAQAGVRALARITNTTGPDRTPGVGGTILGSQYHSKLRHSRLSQQTMENSPVSGTGEVLRETTGWP